MTSSSDTFPFGIADVVELLGLTVRRRLPSSLYLNCPFCGDQRGRLNVNTDKTSGAAIAAARRAVCWHCMPTITAPAMPMPTARYARHWGGTHPGQG